MHTSQSEREEFAESKKQVIGDKWDKAYALLKNVEFNDPEGTLRITMDMFKEIFGTHASFGFSPVDRNLLLQHYSVVPKYWNKKDYTVIFLI